MPYHALETGSDMSKAERGDAILAAIGAAICAWALPHFLFSRLLKLMYGVEFTWWMYLLLFLVLLGGIHGGLAKQRAMKNIAYGVKSESEDRVQR